MSKLSTPSKEDMLKMLPALFLRMLPRPELAEVKVISKKKTLVAPGLPRKTT